MGKRGDVVDYESSPARPPREKLAEVLGAFASVIGLFGCCLSPLAGFMFDAPQQNSATYVLAISTVSLPITCFGAAFISRWLVREDRRSAACWVFAVPLASLATFVTAYAWIRIRHGGSFTP